MSDPSDPLTKQTSTPLFALLRTGFGPQWPPETWRRGLFEYPGAESRLNLGFVVELSDQVGRILGWDIFGARRWRGQGALL